MSRRIDVYLQALVSEEKYAFYETVRDFADAEIAPHLLRWEREHQLVPDDCIHKMAELGLFGLPIAERYGGQGGDHTDLVLMGLALGFHSQSVAITPGAAISLGAKPLQLCGTEAQKAAHLPDLAAGKRMFVFGLSEPGRGSDAANPEVVAVRKGGRWIVSGEKCWSTNARWASHVVVHALTNPNGPNGKRSTCFIVPMQQPGVFYQEMQGKKVWEQSSTGSIMFENVEVGCSSPRCRWPRWPSRSRSAGATPRNASSSTTSRSAVSSASRTCSSISTSRSNAGSPGSCTAAGSTTRTG
jgi:butyryl-CoA dehydrogenase